MKRIFTLVFLISAIASSSFAQGQMDAFNLSYNDLTGTARSVGMGGAFGALGGDVSAIVINPAGIGVYKSNEIVTTMSFTNTKTEATLRGLQSDASKFKFMFDNLAFVGALPLNSDEVPYFNFGISYNKVKSFDRNIDVRSGSPGGSMTDFLTERANNTGAFNTITGDSWNADWLSTLSYRGGLINANPDGSNTFVSSSLGDQANSTLRMRERGSISSFDFNFGTTISDIISLGATLAVTDVDYSLFSDYHEDFGGDTYFLTNSLRTSGTGWQVKAGAILKPTKELRVGVAYHSPTWYNMTDRTIGDVDAFGDFRVRTPSDGIFDYKFRTPDKWVFSLAGVIGQYAIISADYELTNYNNMRFSNRYAGGYEFDSENDDIKTDFRNSSTVRVGAEIRITPQFSGRVGYMWQQSPVKDILRDGSEDGTHTVALSSVTTIPHYSLVGNANHFTWGLGYKFTPQFYTDVAFVIKTRTDDFYNFGGDDMTELKNNQFTGLLTLGYKF